MKEEAIKIYENFKNENDKWNTKIEILENRV